MLDKKANQVQSNVRAANEPAAALQDFSLDTSSETAIVQSRIVSMLRQEGVDTQRISITGTLSGMDDKNVVELAKATLGIAADPQTRGEITPELKERLKAYTPDAMALSEYSNSRTQSARRENPAPVQQAKPAERALSNSENKPALESEPAAVKPAVEKPLMTEVQKPAPAIAAQPVDGTPAASTAAKPDALLGGSSSVAPRKDNPLQIAAPSRAFVASDTVVEAATKPPKPAAAPATSSLQEQVTRRREALEVHIAQLKEDIADGDSYQIGVRGALTRRLEGETKFLEQLKGLESQFNSVEGGGTAKNDELKKSYRALLGAQSQFEEASAREVSAESVSLSRIAHGVDKSARVAQNVLSTAANLMAGTAASTALTATGAGAFVALPGGAIAGATAGSLVSAAFNTTRAAGEIYAGTKDRATIEADATAATLQDVKNQAIAATALPIGRLAGYLLNPGSRLVAGAATKLTPSYAPAAARVVNQAGAAAVTGGVLSLARGVERFYDANTEFAGAIKGSQLSPEDKQEARGKFMAARRLDGASFTSDLVTDGLVSALSGPVFGTRNPASGMIANSLRIGGNTAANAAGVVAGVSGRGELNMDTFLTVTESQLAGFAARRIANFSSPQARMDIAAKPREWRNAKPDRTMTETEVRAEVSRIEGLVRKNKLGKAISAANDPNLLAALDLKANPLIVNVDPTVVSRTQRGKNSEVKHVVATAEGVLASADYNKPGLTPPSVSHDKFSKVKGIKKDGTPGDVDSPLEVSMWTQIRKGNANAHLNVLQQALDARFPNTGTASAPTAGTAANGAGPAAATSAQPNSSSAGSATSSSSSSQGTSTSTANPYPGSVLRGLFNSLRFGSTAGSSAANASTKGAIGSVEVVSVTGSKPTAPRAVVNDAADEMSEVSVRQPDGTSRSTYVSANDPVWEALNFLKMTGPQTR